MKEERIALVTGGTRGLGRETARQLAAKGYHVLLGARDLARGKSVAASIDGSVEAVELDVTSEAQTKRLTDVVERRGRLDVLVNNAGITGTTRYASSVLDLDFSDLDNVFDVNVKGAIRVSAAVVPIMRKRGEGAIVNVSSGMGQLSDMGKGAPAYRLSKTALNAFTRILSQELGDTKIRVNTVCPGWVRTDLGGPSAKLDVEEGASGIVWAATLDATGPTGGFFRHGKQIDW